MTSPDNHEGKTGTRKNIAMAGNLERPERRELERHTVKEGAYALMRQPANKIGQIIDISMSGLAFSYLSINADDSNRESSYMDLLAEDGLLVESLPIKPISKTVIPNRQSFSHLSIWRQSVKFEDMSNHQKRSLQSLIDQYKKS